MAAAAEWMLRDVETEQEREAQLRDDLDADRKTFSGRETKRRKRAIGSPTRST